ncbi:MAG TPA: hypothetical protein VG204_19560 [Terriglobia bacterium]|nr:hypothetical protein [Terriglobia bacterium]
MVQDNRHKGLLRFIRRIIDVPLGYSRDDLVMLRSLASKEYPDLAPLIDQYVRLAERSALDISTGVPSGMRVSALRRTKVGEMHLFDLLREKKLFPSNSDLAEFAGKILPGIKGNRFDKMSRGDIAARVIEHLETKDRRTREELETSMREAMEPAHAKPIERQSFLSKWEKIIKGTKL